MVKPHGLFNKTLNAKTTNIEVRLNSSTTKSVPSGAAGVIAILYRYAGTATRGVILAIDKADKSEVRLVDKGDAASNLSIAMASNGSTVTIKNTSASTAWGVLIFY